MRSPRTLLYAFLVRVTIIGAYFYKYRTIPTITSGLIGLVLGLAGGIYIDISRKERDIIDNLAAGLILSALLRFADIYYGITMLTPSSYRMGIIAVALAAALAALSSESSHGKPARVPILGILAVLAAFVLVFSAITTVQIEKTTRSTMADTTTASRLNGLDYIREYESSTGLMTKVLSYPPHNATGTITRTLPVYSRIDESNTTHTADRVIYVGILIRTKNSNFTRTAGMYQFEITLTKNVTQPDIKIVGFANTYQGFEKIVLENSIDKYRLTITVNVTLTSSDAKLLNAMDRVGVEIDRGDNGANNYPLLPLSITISRYQVEKETINKTYIIIAIIALAIAVIDALPLEESKKRRR